MKALVGAFNQEKALVGAFSVIVRTGCGTDGALHSTNLNPSIIITVTPSFSGQGALMFDVLITSGDPVDKFD